MHPRILYIDIDIHHGDGVEEAFYLTNRVMTLSFHQSGVGGFFPGTGHANDCGAKAGKNYSLNFPLQSGMDDESYASIFKPVVTKVMESFQPGAVVLCCGADSIAGDRVGCWNLSIKGHAACLEHMKTYDVPLLVLGGGGYTIRNVSRCWAYETAKLLDQHISDDMPWHEHVGYYGPDYKLHVPISNMENDNTREDLERQTQRLLQQLSHLEAAPNVQIQTGQPGVRRAPDGFGIHDDSEDDDDADYRARHAKRVHLAEYFDEDDASGDRMDAGKIGLHQLIDPPSDDEL